MARSTDKGRDHLTSLPLELVTLIFEELYSHIPLARFCRLRLVCKLFNTIYQDTVKANIYPKTYYIEMGRRKKAPIEKGGTHVVFSPKSTETYTTECSAAVKLNHDDGSVLGATTTISFKKTYTIPTQRVSLKPNEDSARVHRARYMINFDLNQCKIQEHPYTWEVKHVYRDRIFDDYTRQPPQGSTHAHRPSRWLARMLEEPIARSKPNRIIIDQSRMAGMEPGSMLLEIHGYGGESITNMQLMCEIMDSWREKFLGNIPTEYPNCAFRGLRWIEGITYEVETENELYYLD